MGTTQLELFEIHPPIVHYFDRDEALHSGRLVRLIKRGKKKGMCVVMDSMGKKLLPHRIRNVEKF